jgi:hypothetical protein
MNDLDNPCSQAHRSEPYQRRSGRNPDLGAIWNHVSVTLKLVFFKVQYTK